MIQKWRLIERKLWFYKGFRSNHQAAYRMARDLKWMNGYPHTISKWNEELNKYQIYVRPKGTKM